MSDVIQRVRQKLESAKGRIMHLTLRGIDDAKNKKNTYDHTVDDIEAAIELLNEIPSKQPKK